MPAAKQQDQHCGANCQDGRKHLGDRDLGSPEPKLVRPKSLDPESSDAVQHQVSQKDLSVESLQVLQGNDHQQDQNRQIPQGFVQEGRMHLYIGDPVDHLRMLLHLLRHFGRADRVNRQTHRQQIVRVSSEGFSVEEVSPSSHDLSGHHAEAGGVEDQRDLQFLHAAVDQDCQHRSDQRAVQRKSASAKVKDLIQMILELTGMPEWKPEETAVTTTTTAVFPTTETSVTIETYPVPVYGPPPAYDSE